MCECVFFNDKREINTAKTSSRWSLATNAFEQTGEVYLIDPIQNALQRENLYTAVLKAVKFPINLFGKE